MLVLDEDGRHPHVPADGGFPGAAMSGLTRPWAGFPWLNRGRRALPSLQVRAAAGLAHADGLGYRMRVERGVPAKARSTLGMHEQQEHRLRLLLLDASEQPWPRFAGGALLPSVSKADPTSRYVHAPHRRLADRRLCGPPVSPRAPTPTRANPSGRTAARSTLGRGAQHAQAA
jgi:hypothetical protein